MKGRDVALGIAVAVTAAVFSPGVDRPVSDAPPPPAPPPGPPRTDYADYRWPTDVTRTITSSFGEFRSTHFHAGIDISTRDRVGARVLAARDGSVVRIRVSPSGYGKILYLLHPDGFLTTYAHLDRFAPALEESVRAEQKRLGIYPVSLRFPDGRIPVKRGELIAYSGETGSGTPHIHFEIRDGRGNAVNPMLCPDFRILDGIRPEPRRLAVIPLGPGSTVNGSAAPVVIPLVKQASGEFAFGRSVTVRGRAGIALYIRDRSDGTWFRHGIYRHRLEVNGQPALGVSFDHVPMLEDQQIGLYYHWEMVRARKGRFQKLYIDGSHRLPLYEPDSVGTGILTAGLFPRGRGAVRILTEDFNGNTTVIAGEIALSDPPALSVRAEPDSLRIALSDDVRWVSVAAPGPGGKGWRTRQREPGGQGALVLPLAGESMLRVIAETASGVQSPPWFHFQKIPRSASPSVTLRLEQKDRFVRAVLNASGPLTTIPEIVVTEGARERTLRLEPADLERAEGWFVPDARYGGTRSVRVRADVGDGSAEAEASFETYPVVPGRADTYMIDGGQFRITSGPDAVYDTLWIRLERDRTQTGGRIYRLGPDHAVLRGGITVAMEGDDRTRGDLYVRRRGGWSLVARSISGAATVTGRLRSTLGELTLMEDTRGPAVGDLRFRTVSRKAVRFSFGVDDDLSGVDYDSLKTYIDGTVVIPEIDGEHRRVHYLSRDPFERGPHLLTIRLRDNVGNLTTVERRFVVP